MAFAEDQQALFAVHGLSPDIVLANAPQVVNRATWASPVLVRSEGDWYKARVVDARGNRLRVHYFGYEDSDDEWVLARQIPKTVWENHPAPEHGPELSDIWPCRCWVGSRSDQRSTTTRNGWLTTPIKLIGENAFHKICGKACEDRVF